jgi:site-specific recombinase XerD
VAEKAEAPQVMGSPYVREAVQAWLDYLSTERQLSANTSEAYQRDISQFLAFLAAHLNRLLLPVNKQPQRPRVDRWA